MNCDKKIIVSLTSFPVAVPYATRAIRSILSGSVLPDKLVIYLTAGQFPDKEVPIELREIAEQYSYFEVRFYEENIRSYTKLIPALIDFPDDIIVTIDDDIIYHKNMLKKLIHTHQKYPEAIVGHRIKHIKTGTPYKEWKKYKLHRFFINGFKPKYSNLLTGVGGVLYPPNCLKKEMLDSSLFMDIAPTVDDIWFWAAAVVAGTKIIPVPFGYSEPLEIKKPSEVCLSTVNIITRSGVDVNRVAYERILEKYPLIKERVENEN